MKGKSKKQVTLFGTIILLFVMAYSPNIRFILKMSVKYAHQAGWLVPLGSFILFAPLAFILYKITDKFSGKSLHSIFTQVFGKIIGNITSTVLLLWLMVLLGLYIKYAGEKLVTTVYVGTDLRLLIFLLATLVAATLRWGIKTLVRMSKIAFIIALVQFIIICCIILFSPAFSIDNVTPISSLDIGPVLSSLQFPMTIFIYFTFLFVFNDQIEYGKNKRGVFAIAVGFLVLVNTLMVFSVVGLFGFEVLNKLTFPFITAVENIQIINGVSGLESLAISVWMMFEYFTVCYFAYIIVRLIRDIFGLTRPVPVLTAVLAFGYFFAIFICNDIFELVMFSEYITTPMNLALGLALPFVLFFTAKARRML